MPNVKDNRSTGLPQISFEDMPSMPAVKPPKGSTNNDEAPMGACVFNDNSQVTFAESEGGSEKNNFRIVSYSGGIIMDHWFWGNVAFALDGLKFRKKRTPVLERHFSDHRIGFTSKQEIKDKVVVEGPFLDNTQAQEIRADLVKGFPMEASMHVRPSVVEHVKEGSSVKVNGITLRGPGSVFRQSTIMEVSMCIFGADSKTKSSAYADVDSPKIKFSLLQEKIIMSGENQNAEAQTVEIDSVEKFEKSHPDLFEQVVTGGRIEGLAQGKVDLKADFEKLKAACGDDHELLIQCFSEGKSVTDAMKLHAEKLGKKNTDLAAQVTELQKAKKGVSPAQAEFTDTATPPGDQTETGDADEETMKKAFAELSADERAEYGDVEAYMAFHQADANGQVRGRVKMASSA